MKNDEEKMTALRNAVRNERIDPQGEVADAVMEQIRKENQKKNKKTRFLPMMKRLIPIAAAFVLVCTIVLVIPMMSEKSGSGSVPEDEPANGDFLYSSNTKKDSAQEKSFEAEKRDIPDGGAICAEDRESPEEVEPDLPTEDPQRAPDTDATAKSDPKPGKKDGDADGKGDTTYETTEETKSPEKTGSEETVSEEISSELSEEPSSDETGDRVISGLTGRVGEALGIEIYDDHLILLDSLGKEEYEAFSAAIGKDWTKAEFPDLPAQVFGIGALDALKEAFAESGIGLPDGLEKYDDSYILVVTVR